MSHGHPGPDPPPSYEFLKHSCDSLAGKNTYFSSPAWNPDTCGKVSDFVWLCLILTPTCLQNRLFTLKAIVALIIRCLVQQHAVWIYSLASAFTWFPWEKENKEPRDKVGNLCQYDYSAPSAQTFLPQLYYFSPWKSTAVWKIKVWFFFLSYAGKCI